MPPVPAPRNPSDPCNVEVGTGACAADDARGAGAAAAREAVEGLRRHAISGVLVFASARHDLREVLRGVREVTGDAPLAGATTSGEIRDGEHRGSVVVTVLASPFVRVHVGAGRAVSEGWEAALEQALRTPGVAPYFDGTPAAWAALTGSGRSAFALFFSPGNTRGAVTRSFELTEALKRRSLGRLPVFGGSASDDWKLEENHVLAGGEAIRDGVVVAVVETALEFGIAFAHGLRPLGDPVRVTAASGAEVLTLDGGPAADACASLLGRPREALEGRHLALLTGRAFGSPDLYGTFIPNVPSYLTPRGGVLLSRPVCPGTELSLLVPDPDACAGAGADAVRKALLRGSISEPALVVLASCALRQRLLGPLVEQELPLVRRSVPGVPVVGFASFGEQAPSDDGVVQHTNVVVGALVLGRGLSVGARVARENELLRGELERKAAALAAAQHGLERAVAERTEQLSEVNRQLREEVAERRRAEALGRRHLRALRTLTECNEALVRATSEAALLDEVCRSLVESGGYRMCWVGFAEKDERRGVRPVAHRGFEEGFLAGADVRWDDSARGQGPIGTAIRTGRPAVVHDAETDPSYAPWRSIARGRGFASILALPLVVNGDVIGAFAVYADERGAFQDEAELRLLLDLAGDLSFGIAALRARAERAEVAARAMQSDRLAAVGTLAAGVAHEINNPLAYVLAGVEYAQERLAGDALPAHELEEVRRVLDEIREGGERIRHVVGELRTFSRGDDLAPFAVDLHRVLDTAAKMTSAELRPRARVVKRYGSPPPVRAGEARLGQVFVNLLVNAAHAIPEGSPAAHEVALETDRDARGRAVVRVRDTGCGMRPEVLERMFEPFFTTKPVGVGTGLGLSICRNIVVALGGEIRASSRPGEGTTFEVVLPAAEGALPLPAAPARLAQEPEGAARARVLVVDDEPAVVRAISRALSGDHEVVCEHDPRAVLPRLARGERFDVVLCDLMMPGLSGMDLHAEIAAAHPPLAGRMVFVTGGAFTPAARSFLERIPNRRLEKPFHGQALREVVREIAAAR